MMGYELPEHSEEIKFKEGIMIFINTASYNEIIMNSSHFYGCLKETCKEFVGENQEQKIEVYVLMDKIKAVLNL
ncbi:hypothetical protein [Lysinibacillus sp. NPDC059133]|uniref:hypothetical protein n=1 Tax=Lysinibacillus sp. NPDC059133 TaxID=3346737 RepID=UPI003683C8F0